MLLCARTRRRHHSRRDATLVVVASRHTSHVKTDPKTANAAVATPRGWRLALAGGIAGAISNSLLHPLDTVKTVRQYNPHSFRGVLPTVRVIAAERGIRGLYAGLLPALFGSALSSALYFGAYELAKRRLGRLTDGSVPRPILHGLAAICGNVTSSILFVPKEVVKARMQAGVEQGRFIHAFRGTISAYGLAGLYRGYKATLLRNIPSTVLRFIIFEELRRTVQGDARNPFSLAQFLAAGAVAGAVASGLTTPMDVVKTRLSTGALAKGTGILPALRQIAMREGIGGLYAGVKPRAMWSALGTGVGFGSYELCKALLRADGRLSNTTLDKPS